MAFLGGLFSSKKSKKSKNPSNPSLGSSPKGYNVMSTLNPGQMQIFNQLLGSLSGAQGNISESPLYQSGSSYLQQLLSGSPESTQDFEAPYLRQFNEQTIPGLSERFAGLGAGSSSAFQNALGQAGAGLQEQLASIRGGLRNQGLGQALGYAQQPFSNLTRLLDINSLAYAPKTPGFWQSLGIAGAGGLGQSFGSATGTGLFNKLF